MSDAKPTRFFRLGKLMGLLLLGLVTYLVALVIWVPAGWLWQQASGHVRLPSQVSVRQVSGTLWEGAAGLEVLGYPVRVTWGLGAPSLTGLSLPLEVRLDSVRSHLEGHLTLTCPGAGSLDARGRVDVAEFEDLIRRSGGAMIEGAVDVERLHLVWRDRSLSEADGLARWGGGRVTWPMAGQVGAADFPPMLAEMTRRPGGVSLSVRAAEAPGPAADVQVSWDGMMDIRVYKRMVDLAGQPWSDAARPSDVVFRVRQPLVPGGL